ncbi:MAG: 6-bladed beta-propeller [Candidatus Aminicenantes bacterium]|jgi:hypothetical protein
MKKNTQVISIIIFISTLVLLISFGGQKAEWKGTIEEKDGIKVIKNPIEPLFGELKFELEEDLSIGTEDDDNYMFYMVRGIATDSQQNIYVLDWGNFRIQKFDKNGNYLQTIGRHGQGPGEFEHTMELRIDELTGNIYVKDGRFEIEKFDMKGNHTEAIKLEKPIWNFFPTRNENFIILQFTTSDEEISKAICKLNPKGFFLESYAKVPYQMHYKREGEMVTMGWLAYAYDLVLTKFEDFRYVYGYSKEYELNIIGDEGNLLLKIIKDESYQGFSVREKRKYGKLRDLPSHKPFFYSIITDSRGRIYVQRNRTRGQEFRVNREVDIFSKDGYYLYKSSIPRGTYIIKDGYVYAYVMNEDKGEELVKRYRIKNWKDIKERI